MEDFKNKYLVTKATAISGQIAKFSENLAFQSFLFAVHYF
jgi:hypothetical protein